MDMDMYMYMHMHMHIYMYMHMYHCLQSGLQAGITGKQHMSRKRSPDWVTTSLGWPLSRGPTTSDLEPRM